MHRNHSYQAAGAPLLWCFVHMTDYDRSSSSLSAMQYEPRCEKTGFLHMRKQRRRSAARLISAFVFAILIVQSIYYLNPVFPASSHLLWLYSPVRVGPCRKPRRPVFSQRGSYLFQKRPLQQLGLVRVLPLQVSILFPNVYQIARLLKKVVINLCTR